MRHPVRKLMGAVMVGALGALVALSSVAGAQTAGEGGVAPAAPGDCSVSVDQTNFPSIVVSGTAPAADVVVTAYFLADGASGQTVIGSVHLANGGPFSFPFDTGGASGEVSASYTFGNKNAYTAACLGPGGILSIRVSKEEVIRPASLAFTGSSDTPSFVLIGAGAVVVGLVLVFAARRRRRVDQS